MDGEGTTVVCNGRYQRMYEIVLFSKGGLEQNVPQNEDCHLDQSTPSVNIQEGRC